MPTIEAEPKSSPAPFKRQAKEPFSIQVPPRLKADVERIAERRGHTKAFVVCQALCLGLGIDPAEFGIPPK